MSKLEDTKPTLYNYKYSRYEPFKSDVAEQYISQRPLLQNLFQIIKASAGWEEALLYCTNRQIDRGLD